MFFIYYTSHRNTNQTWYNVPSSLISTFCLYYPIREFMSSQNLFFPSHVRTSSVNSITTGLNAELFEDGGTAK